MHLLHRNTPTTTRHINTDSRNQSKRKPDLALLLVILGLSIFGAIMVYDGSMIVAVRQGADPSFYFVKQVISIILGLIAGYILYRIDYHFIAKISPILLTIAVIFLVMVLIVNQNNEIKRWMVLGPFEFQPSEVAKFAFMIYLSSWLARIRDQVSHANEQDRIWHHIKKELLPFLLLLALVCGLIVIEPDMDTTIMLGVASFIVYFLSGNDRLHTIGALALGTLSGLIATIATVAAKYRMTRISTFVDFWKTGSIPNPLSDGYQFKQILVAVASGGWLGLGFGQSKQKYLYLGDTAFSDTIFAIIAEEFGLIGCIIIISLFLFIFFKGFKIASKAPDKLGYLIAISITTWITLQAFLHIGANVALIPINGNTLPFLSYGGSSTLVNLAAMGVLMNVASVSNKNAIQLPQRQSPSKDAIIKKRSRFKR